MASKECEAVTLLNWAGLRVKHPVKVKRVLYSTKMKTENAVGGSKSI